MAELRRRGQAKFGPQAAQMYFVREALEQASGRGTADYHAARLAASGAAVRGGSGRGDRRRCAGLRPRGPSRDAVRARPGPRPLRGRKRAVWGLADRLAVVQEDVTEAALTAEAAWLDPARRRDSRRVSDPEDYAPPLSWLTELSARGVGSIGVKLSPGIDHAWRAASARNWSSCRKAASAGRRCCGSAGRGPAMPCGRR